MLKNFFFILLQYLIPQHLLSRGVGRLAASETKIIKNTFIRWFADRYQIDMQLAIEENPLAYPSFNAFFTRAIKPEVRPIDQTLDGIVCPADGAISQIGPIEAGRIFQAKGQNYSLTELLGGADHSPDEFQHGQFATIYLSPRDYHRVHAPCDGVLTKMVYIPGDLFSVNQTTAAHVPRLFARNERVVCFFENEKGPFAVVMVGAMIVAGIETVWAGQICPTGKHIVTTNYQATQKLQFKKGEELGRFKLGSTAILVFPKSAAQAHWHTDLQANSPVQMGQSIGLWQ